MYLLPMLNLNPSCIGYVENTYLLHYVVLLHVDTLYFKSFVRHDDLIRKVLSFGKLGREADRSFPKYCQLLFMRK